MPLPDDLRLLACVVLIGAAGVGVSVRRTAALEAEMVRIAGAPRDSADFAQHRRAVDSAARTRRGAAAVPAAAPAIGIAWRARWFDPPDTTPRAARSTRRTAADSTPRHADGARVTRAVDVDIASAEELETLPRVGPALARRIVAHRTRCGPYGTLDALDAVAGVGPALLRTIAGSVTFSGTPRPSHAPGCAGSAR
ncbi:MAG: helix-hairpin-helix domain-containing protein [Gemmatimonadaceae bacterium]|nr:helix-hairpin-helix domain-containing protein [Gemmatimonadaceae bacterium]